MGRLDQLGDAVRSLVKQGDAPQVIRAYHGSPYDWDRVDMSKIGTGEGAQAYGYGFYASQAEPVADWYRRELSGPPEILIGGEPLPPSAALSDTPRERALRLLQKSASRYYDNPVQAVREAVLDASDQYGGRDVQSVIDALLRFKSDGVQFGPRPGKTYELEIGIPEERLIDYDLPLADQTPYIRERLGRMEYTSPGIMRMAKEEGVGRAVVDAVRHSFPDSPAAGSRLLAEAGIPGVRYLDEYSRGAANGTRNYVVFPGAEDSIRILRKFAVPGAIGVGAASLDGQPE